MQLNRLHYMVTAITLTPNSVLLFTLNTSTGLATELFTLIANNQIVNQIRKHCITIQCGIHSPLSYSLILFGCSFENGYHVE